MISFILLILGLLLIVIEFYLPGAIMGTMGGILVFISLIIFAGQSNSPTATVFFTIGVLISVILLIKYMLRYIPKARKGYSIYLNTDQEGFQASSFDASVIGKTGIVLSDLKPGGYILIDGKKFQAISQSGYISSGEEVIVIRGQEESLIVRLKTKS